MAAWAKFLLEIGDGKVPVEHAISKETIRIPDANVLKTSTGAVSQDTKDLIDFVFKDMPGVDVSAQEKAQYFSDKAILTPKNVDADKINIEIQQKLPGEKRIYYSADSVSPGDDRQMAAALAVR
jgi:hypothetical protein